MRYALLVYDTVDVDEATVPADPRTAASAPTATSVPVTRDGPAGDVFDDWVAYTAALHDAGVLVDGEALRPADTATTVRLRGGERLLTDGPFAETKELLLGFYLVDVPDLDAALAWAARMPNVATGAVEVRPVQPGPASARAVRDAARR